MALGRRFDKVKPLHYLRCSNMLTHICIYSLMHCQLMERQLGAQKEELVSFVVLMHLGSPEKPGA